MSGKEAGLEGYKGQPTYTGEWAHPFEPGTIEFSLYVFESHPLTDSVGCAISGIVKDQFGVAVFSGIVTEEAVEFNKGYSAADRKDGSPKNDIVYKGTIGEDGVSGEYFFVDNGNNKHNSTFKMTKVAPKVSSRLRTTTPV